MVVGTIETVTDRVRVATTADIHVLVVVGEGGGYMNDVVEVGQRRAAVRLRNAYMLQLTAEM